MFGKIRQFCENRKSLEGDDLKSHQASRLEAHLEIASTTEFWAKIFAAYGVRTRSGNPFDELKKLPVLSKDQVRAAGKSILNPNLSESKIRAINTSGTTGAGLRFWETHESENERWAVWWRYRAGLGITNTTWCHYFGGRSVVPVSQYRPPYWRVNYPGRQILYSAYHINDKTIDHYISRIIRGGASWAHGYPSVLSLIASGIIEKTRHSLSGISVVTTGAENLLAHQRKIIANAFAAPVHQHYGQAESVANFSECKHYHMHVDEDFSLVEFIPMTNSPGLYRVVGTNFSNPAFPLFRYDTGDVAQLEEEGMKCPCGSRWRMVRSVDGRQEDYVINGKGAVIGRLDHIFKNLLQVREAQIRQSVPGEITIVIVPSAKFNRASDEPLILSEAVERLGVETRIQLEYAESIQRTATGKLRMVVSTLPNVPRQ